MALISLLNIQSGRHWAGTHGLVGLCPTLVTRVRGHLHHGLHVRGTDNNALHTHQLADVVCLHIPHGHVLLLTLATEVDLAERPTITDN